MKGKMGIPIRFGATVAVLAAIGFLVGAQLADAQGIVGSKHDFSNNGWNPSGEICIVCHTPHNADASMTGAPLWNHDVTVATFTLYASPTMDATDASSQPSVSSKLCLSCHDGTVALDSFGGATGTTPLGPGHKANVGIDLSDDHPVSFTYDDTLASADGELAAPSTAPSGLGGTIADDLLISGKLECASCHDVHDAGGNNNLLVKSNANSALCLTCHTK